MSAHPPPWTPRGALRDPLLRRLLLGSSVCYALACAASDYVSLTWYDKPRFAAVAVDAASMLVFWPALCLAALAVADRFPLEGGSPRNLAASAASTAAVAGGLSLAMYLLWYRASPWGAALPPLGYLVWLRTAVMVFPGLLGIAHALRISTLERDQEVARARLERALAEARLAALEAQLHPHFLFNTLQSASTLMHRDPGAAGSVLHRLRDLLRHTSERGGAQEVPLSEELGFTEGYVALQKVRFGDRLAVRTRIDPEALEARVPALLLQPLVENAIRHGVGARPGAGRVEVEVRCGDGELRLSVRDDGPGFARVLPGDSGGVGLANTRARLEALYGPAHRLEVGEEPGGGACVTVTIPLRYAAAGPGRADADDSDADR